PTLPDTSGYAPPDRVRHPDHIPGPPALQKLPKQQAELRPARALPHELVPDGRVDAAICRLLPTSSHTVRVRPPLHVPCRHRVRRIGRPSIAHFQAR
ncbi:hypothetical protein ACU7M0_36515, partial [Burkholderia cenocepacia]